MAQQRAHVVRSAEPAGFENLERDAQLRNDSQKLDSQPDAQTAHRLVGDWLLVNREADLSQHCEGGVGRQLSVRPLAALHLSAREQADVERKPQQATGVHRMQ